MTHASLGKQIKKELIDQMLRHEKGGLYHWSQVSFAYNSNRIEGSRLSEDQTEQIFETNTIFAEGNNSPIRFDDMLETKNHFRLFDYMLKNVEEPLSKEMMIQMNYILKKGTSYEDDPRYNVGGFKVRPNIIVGGVDQIKTADPNNVTKELDKLLSEYDSLKSIEIKDIIDFHVRFERIHPFGDGNGRTGRMIMFKECLKNNLTPFIILDKNKPFYLRGLKEYDNEKGYLVDTCLHSQDIYEAMSRHLLSIECHKSIEDTFDEHDRDL